MMAASTRSADLSAISVIITNYNGRVLLERCLPSVVSAAEAVSSSGASCEVLLVDDCSTDDSRDYVCEHYPSVAVYKPARNLGFQGASNFIFSKTKNPVVISLNNDIEVTPDSFCRLAEHFSDPTVFAVSTKIFLWDHTTYLAGRRVGVFEHGHFQLRDEEGNGSILPTLFATGGACAFDRGKLMALGGFDAIFHPLYWEDIDLCYRAWKRGWKVVYDPGIILYHKHRATIETLVEPDKLKQVTARNSYLFLWKNLSDWRAWAAHLCYAPLWLIRDMVRGRWRFPIGFVMALARLPQVVRSRLVERPVRRRGDRDVLTEIAAA